MVKLFVDLDQVLTNFEQAVKDIGDEPALGLSDKATDEQVQAMYAAIDYAGAPFWANMQWMGDGQELWDKLKGYNPVLLSSPGRSKGGQTFRGAPAGKQEWVNNNVPGTTLICESDKWQYAERDAILIDDNKNNISAWEEAGGIGILHTDTPSTLHKLEEIISTKKLAVSNVLRRLASLIA
jgi:hypothetical protein